MTEDFVGIELSRLESIDFWTPENNLRKASNYSNSGPERLFRTISEGFGDLVSRRYSRPC